MPFLDPTEVEAKFAFSDAFARHWPELRDEYAAVARERARPWHDAHLREGDWRACVLVFSGRRDARNWAACPRTAALLEGVPGLVTAGYFVLAPGAHLPAHRNYPRDVVRMHLGLVVPPACGLRVEEQTRSWEEGRWLVFDPNHVHEAWNRSDRQRVIFLMDVWRDPAHRPAKDVIFHRLDAWRYALAQTGPGRRAVDWIGRSDALRSVLNRAMGGADTRPAGRQDT